MEKDYIFTELFEIYKELLTKNQKEIFDLYYLKDLSLTEIAEIKIRIEETDEMILLFVPFCFIIQKSFQEWNHCQEKQVCIS